MRKPGVAAIVVNTLLFGHEKDYRIHAYGIMPNHVHVIAEFDVSRMAAATEMQGRGGLATSGMAKTVQSWKSVSSHKINTLLGRTGELWQRDYYNHIIRTKKEYIFQTAYVLRNNFVAAWSAPDVAKPHQSDDVAMS